MKEFFQQLAALIDFMFGDDGDEDPESTEYFKK
jgi:hypothetical protein